jgi:hypothetical protein
MSYDDLIDRLAQQQRGEAAAEAVALRLWALVRGAQRAEARTRRHPGGLELVVSIDGELHWSQVYTPALVPTLLESAADAQRAALMSQGWQDAGPREAP